MNAEKLARLQKNVRIGGKGTARRKRKVAHRSANTDGKRLQMQLKRLNVNQIQSCDEVNMFTADGMVMRFKNPKCRCLCLDRCASRGVVCAL
jgi:nascent polypeptide-associated complex subunit beta